MDPLRGRLLFGPICALWRRVSVISHPRGVKVARRAGQQLVPTRQYQR
jgi:hypothetical protein